MHILTLLLWFVCGAVYHYVHRRDTSGLTVIGKVLGIIAVIAVFMAMSSSVALFIIVMVLIMGFIAWCSKKDQW